MDWLKQMSKKAKKMANEQQRPQAGGGHLDEHTGAAQSDQMHTSPPQHVDGITTQVRLLRRQESNYPHVFRDGGGGGTVRGLHLIIFADSTYTRGLPPTDVSRIVNFVSNSIAVIGPSNSAATSIEKVTDFGTSERGPNEAIPFCTNQGERPADTAVWPNHNIASIANGDIGVAFPEVIDRRLYKENKQALLYNTAIEIRIQHGRPVVARPAKSMFLYGEPMFGSFTVCKSVEADGYLYLYAHVCEIADPRSNGLKLARVRPQAWADRSQYEYWNGTEFGSQIPKLADGGAANVFHYSQEVFGKHYGPGTGDIYWSEACRKYIMLFQNGAAALDNSVYLSHSLSLTGGWTKPVSIYKIPRAPDGFSYAFHAYPNMDPTGKVIPITWTQDSKSQSCSIGTAEIMFS